jgi:hypothetical protein
MIRLQRYPTREKDDVIDMKSMPAGPCDMNFRPPNAVSRDGKTTWLFIGQASLTSAFAFGAALFLCWLTPLILVDFEIAAWLLFLIFIPWVLSRTTPRAKSGGKLYAAFVLFVAIEVLANYFFPNQKYLVYVGCLFLVVVPQIVCFSDVIASDYINWVSACPKLDFRTLSSIRQFWGNRFQKNAPVPNFSAGQLPDHRKRSIGQFVQICKLYITLQVFTVVSIVAAVGLAIAFSGPQTVAISILGAITLVLVGMAVFVNTQFQGTFSIVASALRHFVEYQKDRRQPPWVCPSPIKQISFRHGHVFVSILLLSFFINGSWLGAGAAEALLDTTSMTGFVLLLLIQIFTAVILAPVLLFSWMTLSIGPVLWAHHQACEGDHACLARVWTEFEAYTDRLRNSSNQIERDSIWLGFHQTLGFPILLDVSLIKQHTHILGATGSGKTGLGISTLAAQLIKRGDGPVIILDCKGDPALLHSSREWARQSGRKFKWFTTAHGKSTYIFNPFDQSHLNNFTLQELVGLFLLSFNLHHGDDYGRSWFAAVSKAAFLMTVNETAGKRPNTFEDFQRILEVVISENSEFKDAAQLMFVMRNLAAFKQMNLSRATNEDPACAHAIHLPEVIENKEVIYFNFESLTDPSTAGEISRLVTYCAVSAAKEHKDRTGQLANVYLIVDEAQNVVAKNVTGVLEQARSSGLSCVLSHQTRSQLNPPGGVDLREIVESCTCAKILFSARDPDTRKYLSAISGEVAYFTPRWRQFIGDFGLGQAGLHRALGFFNEQPIADVAELVGPRITDNDISAINCSSNLCAFSAEKHVGYSRFRGAFPIHVDYPVSERDYETRSSQTRWPSAPGETIDIHGFWPEASDETVVAAPPKLTVDFDDQALTTHNLDELKKRLKFDESNSRN